MKNDRHTKILELIKQYDIETQEELTEMLCKHGYNVTQATVSRDIKALKLIKITSHKDDGGRTGYKYAVHASAETTPELTTKFHNLLKDIVVSADYAGNLAVIKTYSGMANAAAAAIDATHNESIVGSVAGDDTLLCVLRTEIAAKEFSELIKKSVES